MQTPRETIYAALFAKFSTLDGIVTASRRLRIFSDVTPEEMPALFMAEVREVAEKHTGRPTVWRLHVEMYLYADTTGDETAIASSILNPIVDELENALEPNSFNSGWGQDLQTVGIVEARILGPIEIFEGQLGQTAIVIVPLEVLAL
jgi:hypothetical protein